MKMKMKMKNSNEIQNSKSTFYLLRIYNFNKIKNESKWGSKW